MAEFVPLWRQVMEDIQTRISRGLLKPGDKLPSTREMADQYDTSPGTIRKAIDILIAMGVLRGHQGKGTYVAGETSDGNA
jgi:DNA-binding GntR family transcriptional regulator